VSFGGAMHLDGISSDEQPTQELNLNEQNASPASVGQQPAQMADSVHQNTEQKPIQEMNTQLLSTVSKAVEQHGQEQQAAIEVNLEQQATLPLVFEQSKLKQSPVEPKVAGQEAREPGAPVQRIKQQGRRSHFSLLWWVLFVFFAFWVVFVVVVGSAIEGWFPQNFGHNNSPILVEHVKHPLPTPTQTSPIDSTTTLFMNAMLHKDWASMWPMLSPDAQKLCRGEKDFIHFEQAKFGSLRLTSYTSSPVQMYNSWLDPNTTQVYSHMEVLYISLEASAPPGLLSAPSNFALRKGLFHHTLFALVYYQFNWRVLVAGPADLDAPVLVPASPPATKLLVPIFMYHHVSNLPTMNYLDYGLTVTTTNFNAQLDWLQKQGYHSITHTELFDALYYGKALPAHPMMLTFDDGYEDVYMDALPALLAHHYRGVFYIITGMIGGNYMTWPQVRKLAQDGMQVSSHTIHHVNVGQPPSWTTTQNELLVSKATLEAQLKQPVQFFCYPYGEPFHHDSVYEQQIVLADLFKDGYVSATLDPFSYYSAIQDAQTPYQLPRVRVSGGESLQLFTSILNSTLYVDASRIANGYSF
jgi:peptidoglycan/xylan/chitin deacetylase (PgdA/CDA1 family)